MPGKKKIPCPAGMVSLILLGACSSAIVTAAAAAPDNATLVRMHGGTSTSPPTRLSIRG